MALEIPTLVILFPAILIGHYTIFCSWFLHFFFKPLIRSEASSLQDESNTVDGVPIQRPMHPYAPSEDSTLAGPYAVISSYASKLKTDQMTSHLAATTKNDTLYEQNNTSSGLDSVVVSLLKRHIVCLKRHIIFYPVCPPPCCSRCARHSPSAMYPVQSDCWLDSVQSFGWLVQLFLGLFLTGSDQFLRVLGILNSNHS